MNVKKIIKCIGFCIILSVAIIFTTAFFIGKGRASDVSNEIRLELANQAGENRKLRSEIIVLQREQFNYKQRITELEGIELRLNESNIRLEEFRKAYERNNRELEIDIEELGGILSEDRKTVNRIREILEE